MAKKPKLIRQETVDENNLDVILVDCSHLTNGKKEVSSKHVIYEGIEYWQARHSSSGIYYTANARDPKVLTFSDPGFPDGKNRGNLVWSDGKGGNPAGRAEGSLNKMTVKSACDNLGVHPAEFLAAIMKGDHNTLRNYGVRDTKGITLSQKLMCATKLLDKTQGNVKGGDVDAEGNLLGSLGLSQLPKDEAFKVQVYMPSSKSHLEIETTESEAVELNTKGILQFSKDHKSETAGYDTDNEEDTKIWENE